ncbi:MAG: DMT family transporter [Granulosicoccus sp.]|nr:DMT family transporter [Granulosicoccus sp.]
MTIRGITYLVTALFIFTAQDAVVKYLSQDYEVIQILTWRILLVVLIIGSIALQRFGWRHLKTDRWSLMLVRGCLAFLAFTNYYIALSYIPLADAATVYMTAPLFVTALSVPLLGEKVGLRRWLAVIIGFGAVVFMLNPGSGLFQAIAVLPLLSALFYSFIPIVTRKIDSREHVLTITFYTASSYALLCILFTIAVHLWPSTSADTGLWSVVAQRWPPLTGRAWMLLILSSVMFASGILFITAAYRAAEVSVLAPFEYSYLLWATVIGYIVFTDVPTLRTWVAGLIIAGSGIYIAIRERRVSQAQSYSPP